MSKFFMNIRTFSTFKDKSFKSFIDGYIGQFELYLTVHLAVIGIYYSFVFSLDNLISFKDRKGS